MAGRVKEDEKNERIIRGLLKLPENRRCINCNSLGPQYVCTNFWTFVCTSCSGIHREFTHRVKSVSMAKFTSQEVAALQEGGNQRARDIYLKEWDPQRQSSPDRSNVERLRDFIKHVYVDRRYSGERNYGKPPSMKGDREDSYQGGSHSPLSEDAYERHRSEMSSPGARSDDKISRYGYDERRSPGYDQESRQFNDYRRSPARPDVINDWRREDRFGNGRKVEDRRISDGDTKQEGRSPERLKDQEVSSPPIARPVREILGDNVVPLRISEPPKANVVRAVSGPAQTQRTASSSSLGSTNGNPAEVKLESNVSLIDFDAEPEPPASAAVTQVQQTTVPQSIAQPASTSNDNNWASFDVAPHVKSSQSSSSANPLESVLLQLSVPASGIPSGSVAPVASSMGNAAAFPITGASPIAPAVNASMLPFNAGTPAVTSVNSFSTFHPAGVSTAASGLSPAMPVNGGTLPVKVNEGGQWPSMQHQQPSLFPASHSHSAVQQFTQPLNGTLGSQPWNNSQAPNAQSAFSAQSVGAALGAASAGILQPSSVEVKSTGRKELPVDLFAASYPSFTSMPGWQTGPARGMGFAMQYNNAAVPVPTFVQPSKSMNPFDLSEPAPVQAQTFPSMTSLQGALPNMPPSGLQHITSFGTPSPAWMPSQSLPYPTAFPSQSPSYVPTLPPRAHMAQGPSNMSFSGHQGMGVIGSDGATFGAINTDQQLAGRFSAPATPQPFTSVGGNPFG